ncbi:MAG: hypothetical protein Kow0058_17100 [Roseovarius sp.]
MLRQFGLGALVLALTSLAAGGIGGARAQSAADSVGTRIDTSALVEAAGLTSEAAKYGVRVVKPPKLFDKAFRDASAARHAQDIAELTQAFIALDPAVVDPAEAARAARAVYTYVDQLVVEYQIEDSPLVHNTKVNMGIKPRGLCWHWAHDLDLRLQMERFRTLEIHRAIANYNNIRLEHSTTLLGPKGGRMEDAIVLDPWRKGGELVWKIAREDTRYNWTEREQVFAYKRKMAEARARRDAESAMPRRRDR